MGGKGCSGRLAVGGLSTPDPGAARVQEMEGGVSFLGGTKLLELRAANALLAGARIERVLVGCQADVPLLVIETDREDPDSGCAFSLLVSGAFNAGVGLSLFKRLPSEVVGPS